MSSYSMQNLSPASITSIKTEFVVLKSVVLFTSCECKDTSVNKPSKGTFSGIRRKWCPNLSNYELKQSCVGHTCVLAMSRRSPVAAERAGDF